MLKLTNRRPSGFTLIELMAVVFIISLLTAVVLPSFFRSGDNRLKSEARKMASLLRYLNDSSISTKKILSLKFDIQEGSMSWLGPDGEKSEQVKSLAGVELQSKGDIKEGQVTVFFGPLGITENISVHLKNDKKAMTVTLNAISGRAKITDDE
ncbi:MAG: prepilin-type N-terminal cleavage/methylation domain-containing protein [Nitrospirae bacterium]|nr:prepilin-type N-terminal cleavage/methylation domain-containing protein [Nitrospirota bacterium]